MLGENKMDAQDAQTQQSALQTSENGEKTESHFAVLVTGQGYLTKIVTEKLKNEDKGKVTRVTLSMLHGSSKKPSREFYSLTVCDRKTLELLKSIENSINDKDQRVAVYVDIEKGDSSAFVRNTGKLGITHFGRLNFVKRVVIDGVVKYDLSATKETITH